MERRIGHWAAVGLMYNLSEIKDESLSFDDEAPDTKQIDFKLSLYLQAMAGESLVKILKFHPLVIPSDTILPEGDSTGTEIVLPCLQRLCQETPHSIYNKETVIEFHHLLVATMLCYARSLRGLRKAHEMQSKQNAMNSKGKSTRKETNLRGNDERKSRMARNTRGDELDIEDLMETFDALATRPAVSEEEEEETKGKEKEEEEETKRKEEEAKRKEEEEEAKRKEEEAKRKEDAARGLFIISRLLNAILVSGAFQRHIRCLVKNKCLSIPMDMHQEHFRKFAETKDIPWQQSRKIQTEMFQSLRPEESDSIAESEGTRSSREGDQDPFEINNDEDVIMAIQGWVKLFVQHLHAKSILESFARRGTRDISIDIKVYGVGPSQNPLPLPSWEDLEKIIRSSLQNKKIEEQDNMIEVFRSHFQTSSDNIAKDDNAAMAHSSRSSGKNPIFTVISDIITQKAKTRPRYYNIHCEAALAGLVSASMDPANALAPYADNDFIAELLVGLILSISHFSG
jgi:hypothetical protein